MAVTALEVPYRADHVHRWRRPRLPRWTLPIVVGLLIVGALAGAGARVAYVYSFQPFGFGGGFIGPEPYGGNIKIASDGLADTEYVLVGAPGARGTVAFPFGNDSDQDVRVLGAESNDDLIASLRWASNTDAAPIPHSFPMTLKAHQSMTLLVTVTKPSYCGSGRYDAIIGIPIRYEAFGVTHTYQLPLRPGSPLDHDHLPIALCVDPHRSPNLR